MPKVEVLCSNIMLDEMRYKGWKGEVSKEIVDIVNESDAGYGSPRIKVTPKKKAAKKNG
jgi:hypothetical protein